MIYLENVSNNGDKLSENLKLNSCKEKGKFSMLLKSLAV